MKYGIFTKPIHLEKLVNFLNTTSIDYLISTKKEELSLKDFDIGVSYCFPYKVDIKDKRAWYNYHPAPLPEYRGWNNYVDAINDKVKEYGVSLHVMSEEYDRGNILRVNKFNLESIPSSVGELGTITHYHLFQLFKETIQCLEHKPKTEKELKEML